MEFCKPEIKRLTGEALARLEARDGEENNVRELSLAIRRAVIFCDRSEITPQHLTLSGPLTRLSHRRPMRPFDRQQLEQTRTLTGGRPPAATWPLPLGS